MKSIYAVGLVVLATGCGGSLFPNSGDPRGDFAVGPDMAPGRSIDLSSVDLSKADLSSIDLSSVDLSTIDLAKSPDLTPPPDFTPPPDLTCNPAACPTPATSCQTAICQDNACATSNQPPTTACTDNGGALCDGNGACVACLAATDCSPQPTVCKINACDVTHSCGITYAQKGTSCVDSGGIVCDGAGSCVASHCMDGVEDGGETDVDCGGTCGATCTDAPPQECKVGGDCISGVCDGLVCAPPSCTDGVKNGNETATDCGGGGFGGNPACAACADGLGCGVNSDCVNGDCFTASPSPATCISCGDHRQNGTETGVDCGGALCDGQGKPCGPNSGCAVAADCQSGNCHNGTCALRTDGSSCTANAQCADGNCVSGICCNTACTGTCMACGTGTCLAITGGVSAPSGQCAANSSCGNDGNCNGSGGCEQMMAGTGCAAAFCKNGYMTSPASCDGAGGCGGTVTLPCAGGVTCTTDNLACLAACGSDGDCQDPTTYCAAGSCHPRGGAGATCTGADACTGGSCAGGACCAGPCLGAGTTCGTTGCATGTGQCLYPSSGIGCGQPACKNGLLTTAAMCDGAGSCSSSGVTTNACAGGFICADMTSCKVACTLDTDCQSASDYCNNGACAPREITGTSCSSNDQCSGNLCLTDCCATACVTGGTCGATSCGAATGLCQYPAVGLSCGTGEVCDGAGNCVSAHGTKTFGETDTQQTFVVPDAVTTLTVDVMGAAGEYPQAGDSSNPGNGGRVQGTLTVTPGATIYVYVGGRGSSSCVGGYNGGGTGSCGDPWTSSGGGASDLRIGGSAVGNRVVVAGGGGGSGDGCDEGEDPGGVGGGASGGTGVYCVNSPEASGGTQAAGGVDPYDASDNGQLANGGASEDEGGGGGGGYYGGAAGEVSGGGGGSSYTGGLATVTNNQSGANSGAGSIKLTW